jgi:hypothetical protein
VGGIVKDRDSLFFIPTFTGIWNTTENSQYILEFKGTLVIPCNVSLCLIFLSSSDFVQEIENVEWKSEPILIGTIEKSLVDGGKNEMGVFGYVIFDGNSGMKKETSGCLLRNKI